MKLCKECAHCEAHHKTEGSPYFYGADYVEWVCVALKDQENPVYGTPISHIKCDAMRLGGPCGWEGALWKAKE